jgi:Flp pilus assembly protein TadG
MPTGGHPVRHPRDRGQSLVEFALVIPVFLLILFAILDFGFLLFSRITLVNATREGAHAAVTQVDNGPGIPAIVSSAIQANAGGLVWNNVSVATTCVDGTPTNGVTCNFVTPDSVAPGDSVLVHSTYTYYSFFTRFFGTSVNFDASVRMVME